MSSNLHQIQLTYDQTQDRLILTFFTQDFCEYRFWITRHMLKALWGILQQLLKQMSKEDTQQEENRKAAGLIQKETQQPQASKYGTRITQRPLGEEPLLLYKVMAKPVDKSLIHFHLEDTTGKAIDFSGTLFLVNVLCQMMRKSCTQADWQLELP